MAGSPSTLRVAANAASMLGQHDAAIGYLRKSAQIDANPHSVARTRVLIAAELRVAGKLAEAEAELLEPQESANALVRAEALEERAHLRLAQNRPDAAIEDLRAADRQYAALGLEFNRIDTNTALSQALLGKRDVPGAIAAADEAIAIVTRIRVKSANPEWRARFLSARYAPYEARIAAELASADAGAVWRAFRTAEEVRARSLARRTRAGRDWRDSAGRSAGRRTARAADLAAVAPGSPHPAAGRRRSRNARVAALHRGDARATRCHSHPPGRSRRAADFASRVAGAGAAAVAAGHGGARVFRRRQQRACLAAHAQRVASCRSARPRAGCSEPSARRSAATQRLATPGERHLGSMLLGHLLDGIPETPHAGAGRRSSQRRAVRVAARAGRRRRTADRSIRVGVCAIAGSRDGKRPAGEDRATRASRWSPIRCMPPTIAGCSCRQERRLRHAARRSAALA